MRREHYLLQLDRYFAVTPIVAILGPRQCGKTTLARAYKKKLEAWQVVHYFDLENPQHLTHLQERAQSFLNPLRGLIIIDEIQRRPELFPLLRVLVDEHQDQHFLILGSSSRGLLRQSSESLAGRISYLELTPFSLSETHDLKKLWERGGFPRSYLADNTEHSLLWRRQYIKTFLEIDIPQLGIDIPPERLRRFWMMLSHYHGQIFNASEIGRSLMVTHKTTDHYLDVLVDTLMVRRLMPWFENIAKRQVKTPKLYFRDSGILHSLLGINDFEQLQNHPKLGASWEGFALEEVIRFYQVDALDCYFWGVHAQAELDLLILHNGKRLGFEFKFTDTPTITRSMHFAMDVLQLDELNLIYPGTGQYQLDDKIKLSGLLEFINH